VAATFVAPTYREAGRLIASAARVATSIEFEWLTFTTLLFGLYRHDLYARPQDRGQFGIRELLNVCFLVRGDVDRRA